MSGPELITFGCRLNLVESAAIRALAVGEDDLIVINSCAVTAEAVRQARQAIRRAKRTRPDARIVVTGCAAQIEPGTFAAMPEVARVVGNADKYQASAFLPSLAVSSEVETRSTIEGPATSLGTAGFGLGEQAEIRVSDIMAVRETAPHLATGFAEHARAFIEVQNGCDHRCTFCVIPYGRGNSRSVPAGQVIERIKALVGEGHREVVLTGVDVTSYGPDLPGAPTLGLLIERILRHVPDLPRLRLSSLDSVEIDERMFELVTGEARVMPHLHLSLQAGDDMVLKRMKRRHLRGQAIEIVGRLKTARPEIAIGADLIAGFPTEDEAMAANSLALIDECDIVFAHVFPFSPRSGTPAARMPQVAPMVARARAKALREASGRRRAAWLAGLMGTTQRVLIENDGVTGHAENFARVRLSSTSPRHPDERRDPRTASDLPLRRSASMASGFRRNDGAGAISNVRVTAIDGDTLIGIPA